MVLEPISKVVFFYEKLFYVLEKAKRTNRRPSKRQIHQINFCFFLPFSTSNGNFDKGFLKENSLENLKAIRSENSKQLIIILTTDNEYTEKLVNRPIPEMVFKSVFARG